jgi:hypothetical protein
MAATVLTPTGAHRTVKNLGWALRHPSAVQRITVDPRIGTPTWGARVTLEFADGHRYVTEFASRRVLWDWLLARRKWTGSELLWFGERCSLGPHLFGRGPVRD